MTKDTRTQRYELRLTEAERKRIEKLANAAKMSVADWIRMRATTEIDPEMRALLGLMKKAQGA